MGGCLYSRRNYNPHYYQDPLLDEYGGDPQLGDPVDHGVYRQEWDRPFQDIHKSTDQYQQQNRLSDVFSSFTTPQTHPQTHPQQFQTRGHAYTAHVPTNRYNQNVNRGSWGAGPYGNQQAYQSPQYSRQYSGRLSTSSAGSGSHHSRGSYGRQHSGHSGHGGPYPSHYSSERDSYGGSSVGMGSTQMQVAPAPAPHRQQSHRAVAPPPEEPSRGFPMTLRIQSLKSTYPVVEARVLSTATVAVLKEKICEIAPDKIDPDRQRLVHRGRQLKDHKTMEEYSIQDGHTIMLVRSRHKSPAPSVQSTGAVASPQTPSDYARSRAYTAPAQDTLSPIAIPDRGGSASPALSSSSVDSGFHSDDPSEYKRRKPLCSKCQRNPVGEFIVVPCGHKCLCDTCEANTQLKVDRCPQCIKESPDDIQSLPPISSVVKIKGP